MPTFSMTWERWNRFTKELSIVTTLVGSGKTVMSFSDGTVDTQASASGMSITFGSTVISLTFAEKRKMDAIVGFVSAIKSMNLPSGGFVHGSGSFTFNEDEIEVTV